MKKTVYFILLTSCLFMGLTGCGASTTTGSTSGNNDPNVSDNTTNSSMANDAENGVGDVVDNVGNAADDLVDGVGNAVNDLVGGTGFDNYSDAHDYFLDTMGNYHSDAKFELRDEREDLFDYQEGSKGYRFHLYDTSNESDSMFGEFYVDANSGLIYKVEKDGTIREYPTNNNGNNNNRNNNNNNNNINNNNNNTNNNKQSSNNKTNSPTTENR